MKKAPVSNTEPAPAYLRAYSLCFLEEYCRSGATGHHKQESQPEADVSQVPVLGGFGSAEAGGFSGAEGKGSGGIGWGSRGIFHRIGYCRLGKDLLRPSFHWYPRGRGWRICWYTAHRVPRCHLRHMYHKFGSCFGIGQLDGIGQTDRREGGDRLVDFPDKPLGILEISGNIRHLIGIAAVGQGLETKLIFPISWAA